MRRLWFVALGASLAATACKIERTPQEYIDHRTPVQQARADAEEELDLLLAGVRTSLEEGAPQSPLDTLALADEAYLIVGSTGRVEGEAAIRAAMRRWLASSESLRVEESRVAVGPRGTTAWFLVTLAPAAGEERVQLTGVMTRETGGSWQLVQAHLSDPPPPAATAAPSP